MDAIGHDPIERSDDDRLGRKDFAQLLAKALAGSPERRSMVVALYGDWGSGKTSTLNLCFEALGELPAEAQPLMVRFNPWWYSNTGELLAQFFEELGTALEEQAESKGIGVLKGIKDKLLSYRKLVAPAGAAADLLVSGGALTVLASLLQAGAERAAQGQEAAPDVRKIRGEIEAALAEVGRRVVIAIDDIDRLSAPEIRDVFKVVKATADFPNTRYLLAFDFGTVTNALSEVQRTDGVAYLEKIVQVPFRLPDPDPGQLMDIVKDGVRELASRPELGVPAEDVEHAVERLGSLALYGLGSLWDNMRRVSRFLDSLRLTLPAVADEVRLSDFVLLEALRVTEPRAYELVLDGQNLLVGTTPGAEPLFMSPRSGDPQEMANRATTALVDAVCEAPEREELKVVIREVLEELFPRAEAARRGAQDTDGATSTSGEATGACAYWSSSGSRRAGACRPA
ncbi:MAG: KAP family NTPase [Actinomycetota bacterium]|nr:KAP family NTPase [Actinomycetota bacterium]